MTKIRAAGKPFLASHVYYFINNPPLSINIYDYAAYQCRWLTSSGIFKATGQKRHHSLYLTGQEVGGAGTRHNLCSP
jgi:hypothetical protein